MRCTTTSRKRSASSSRVAARKTAKGKQAAAKAAPAQRAAGSKRRLASLEDRAHASTLARAFMALKPHERSLGYRQGTAWGHERVDAEFLARELQRFGIDGCFVGGVFDRIARHVWICEIFAELVHELGRTAAIERCVEYTGASESTVRDVIKKGRQTVIDESDFAWYFERRATKAKPQI